MRLVVSLFYFRGIASSHVNTGNSLVSSELTLHVPYHTMPHKLCRFELQGVHGIQAFVRPTLKDLGVTFSRVSTDIITTDICTCKTKINHFLLTGFGVLKFSTETSELIKLIAIIPQAKEHVDIGFLLKGRHCSGDQARF